MRLARASSSCIAAKASRHFATAPSRSSTKFKKGKNVRATPATKEASAKHYDVLNTRLNDAMRTISLARRRLESQKTPDPSILRSQFGKQESRRPEPTPVKQAKGKKRPPSSRPPIVDQMLAWESAGHVQSAQYAANSSEPTLKEVEPLVPQRPVAQLAHGLDRVLFNPGITWMRDPRSGVFNFPPGVQNIPKLADFAFERLPPFTSSSRDQELWELARARDKPFAGSTSSLSGMLSHIYFLISGNRTVNLSGFTPNFSQNSPYFTPAQRMAHTAVYHYNDGRYAIDQDNKFGVDKNLLTWMGHLLEAFLTTELSEFSREYLRSGTPSPKNKDERRDAFRFSESEKFVMRSQLDCQDHRLPGTGVFDLKTRASVSIRMDILNFETNSGYLIKNMYGTDHSFEREYYDLVRAAFLKYQFQVRIGNMDGIFLAYHNTEEIFGFQYISLAEMDECLMGPGEGKGDRVFKQCVKLLEDLSTRITDAFPGESVKATFETAEHNPQLNVWIEPAEWPNESEDNPRPMRQLVVTADHFLDQKPVGPRVAMDKASNTTLWEIKYNIADIPQDDTSAMRRSRDAAYERGLRAFSLPDGYKRETVLDFWNGLNFDGQKKKGEPIADMEWFLQQFTEPDAGIIALRQAARDGRHETQRRKEAEDGLPKFVIGEKYDPEDALRKKEQLAKAQRAQSALTAKPGVAKTKDTAAMWDPSEARPKQRREAAAPLPSERGQKR
ncbi:Pet127-domain-containing protein [Cylindrobasidium torrendii FP15055 ss-10]|uniref:Pet127-domain-containing protein n=1 Tax=Cylindrobasidium torrendii FP15055 ss-10 TaxID=1314674 RepID=A0A0D7B9D2_9AGAR|nr:Pet127-domain-containing protein [Cylindrobasidium torrendii FP15055 ss-10]